MFIDHVLPALTPDAMPALRELYLGVPLAAYESVYLPLEQLHPLPHLTKLVLNPR